MMPEFALNDILLGTDLVYVPRLEKSLRRYGPAFFARLLTTTELAYCKPEDRAALFLKRAAGRIAVKEAVSKALGVGINGLGWQQGVGWQEIEVLSQSQSPPGLQLHGRALKLSTGCGVRAWRISLSHDGDYAMATALGLI